WATRASHEYIYDHPLATGKQKGILEPDPQSGYVKHRICHGPAMDIRFQLFMARDASRLFDTQRWTKNLERGFEEAWRRWVTGEDEASALCAQGDLGDDDDGVAAAAAAAAADMDVDDLQRRHAGCKLADSHAVSDLSDEFSILSASDARKVQWCRRIEREMAKDRARRHKQHEQQQVFAPPGRCIWVCDEDDAMPSHAWLYKMMSW
ncbi:hypothetical protein GGI12_006302, partial [Dipsacomyces acuminosporus]